MAALIPNASRRIPVEEFFPWQRPVIDFLDDPPANPAKADRYIVGTGTGVWAGHDTAITWFDGFNWRFDAPVDGWFVYDKDSNLLFLFNGAAWTNTY